MIHAVHQADGRQDGQRYRQNDAEQNAELLCAVNAGAFLQGLIHPPAKNVRGINSV